MFEADLFGFRSAATSQSSRDQKPPPPVTADERRLLRGNYVRYVGKFRTGDVRAAGSSVILYSNGEQAVPIKPAPRKVRPHWRMSEKYEILII